MIVPTKMHNGMLKKESNLWMFKATCRCLAGNVCKSACVSVFAPQLFSKSIYVCGEYADGCLFKEEQIGTLFV
jgi:hypothetical protein